MPVGKLSAALVEAFGRQAMHVARQLQEQILSGPLEKTLKTSQNASVSRLFGRSNGALKHS